MMPKNIKTVNPLGLPFYVFMAALQKDQKSCILEFCNYLKGTLGTLATGTGTKGTVTLIVLRVFIEILELFR